MGKLQNNQKGFTAVEGLLIVLILVVIGAVGYMVYHNTHKTKTLNTSTSATTSPNKTTISNNQKTVATVNPYAGWKTYRVDGISFMYPASWTIGSSSEVVSASSIPFNPGAVPTNQPQYNNNVVFTVQLPLSGETYSAPSSEPIRNGLILQSGVTVNGASNYCFVGNANQSPGQAEPVTTTSNVAQIEFAPCDSSAKTVQDFLSTSDNKTNFTVLIRSGNPEANAPLNLSGSDYPTVKLIAESLKF